MPPLVQYFKIPASQQWKQFLKQLGTKSQLLYEMLASWWCNSIPMFEGRSCNCVCMVRDYKITTHVYAVFQLYPWLIFGLTSV